MPGVWLSSSGSVPPRQLKRFPGSSWRKRYGLGELADRLAAGGLSRQRVIDVTGDRSMLGWDTAGPEVRFRGAAIADWLAERAVAGYVILDDDPDMLTYQWRYFVQTDPFVGLTRADIVTARRILMAD